MRFAHVSDFHYTCNPEEFPSLRTDLVEAIDKLIAELKNLEKYLDFVAITGDIAEAGDSASYQRLKSLLEAFSIPVYLIPGNHDQREPMRNVYSSFLPLANSGPLDFHIELGDTQIIGLDTLIEGKDTGQLSEVQLSWFSSHIRQNHFAHSVIMIHHPPFPTGLSEFDSLCTLEGHSTFSNEIAGSNSDITILCGHVHRPYQALWNGANCYIAGSPASQYDGKYPFGDWALEPVKEPFSYLIHTLDTSGNHIVNSRFPDLGA
ncbi:MAG: metallophosphoesterase [Granulosicoccus sp.]